MKNSAQIIARDITDVANVQFSHEKVVPAVKYWKTPTFIPARGKAIKLLMYVTEADVVMYRRAVAAELRRRR